MNFIKPLALSALILSLAACSHSKSTSQMQLTEAEIAQVEDVYQFTVKSKQVSFVVKSHGCTLPEHFKLKQHVTNSGRLKLALLRLKQDRCRAMPRAYPVSFKLDRRIINKHDIYLLNKIETEIQLPRRANSNIHNMR